MVFVIGFTVFFHTKGHTTRFKKLAVEKLWKKLILAEKMFICPKVDPGGPCVMAFNAVPDHENMSVSTISLTTRISSIFFDTCTSLVHRSRQWQFGASVRRSRRSSITVLFARSSFGRRSVEFVIWRRRPASALCFATI